MKKKPYGRGKALRRKAMARGERIALLKKARMEKIGDKKYLVSEQNGIRLAIDIRGNILGRVKQCQNQPTQKLHGRSTSVTSTN